MTKISVVICFRDWGLERLVTNVRLHLQHCRNHECEVVVADYGSKEPEPIRKAVEAAGGQVIRVESAHLNWNRSAALNAGVAASTGDIIITTDADIFFSPQTYDAVLEAFENNPDALYLVQCRDLPPSVDVDAVKTMLAVRGQLDFDHLHKVSTLRPRWGMGGLAAFSRAAFHRLNGYEDRMELWGKEDTDFAKRFNLNRMPLRWITRKDVGIYHVWHESSKKKAMETAEGRALLAENQRILDLDNTPVRNLNKVFGDPIPPISIIIPTYNRNSLLLSCLESVKNQTFRNFEVLVVENGGTRDAQNLVASLNDARFRYVFTARKGAAAARNLGVEQAIGRYIVIMDDDDLMVSTRVEDHLKALAGGSVHGSHGGWIDFCDATGEVMGVHPGRPHSLAAMIAAGRVIMHAASMVERGVFRVFRYDESRQAGIDHALMLRLTYHGLRIAHTVTHVLLRRIHATNMTFTLSAEQKEASIHGQREINAAIGQDHLKELRQHGRDTPFLDCVNEEQARLELGLAIARERELRELCPIAGFDPERYMALYPDVRLSGLSPLQHYVRYGRGLGRTLGRPMPANFHAAVGALDAHSRVPR